MIIKIPLLARPKKNSQQILKNSKTGKYFISQSKAYKNFERECGLFLSKYRGLMISYPINLKCLFYVSDRIKRDLTNLENSIADILVKYEVLKDDNYNILAGWDGSRIIYRPKVEPEIVIEITKMEESNYANEERKSDCR